MTNDNDVSGASERSARVSVIRQAIIYTPLFVAGLILTALSIPGVINAGIVLTILEAVLTALFGYQSIQALRDLQAELVRTEGVVGRHWSKMDFIITRSHYIAVGRAIFNLPVEDWYLLDENDRVVIDHYPHTGTVARVERIPGTPEAR